MGSIKGVEAKDIDLDILQIYLRQTNPRDRR